MGLYRCMQCRAEFDARAPVCVPCGIDPAKNPRHTDLVLPLVLHHYDPPTSVEGIGTNRAACNRALRVGAPKCAFTGDKNAVNCPKCKLTKEFLDTEAPGPGIRGALAKMTVASLG